MPQLVTNFSGLFPEAGVDEAGRGCMAGPVFAAAVILPENFSHPFLNDSKQLSEKQRNELRPVIEETAIAYAVAYVEAPEIDKINILNASIKAMHLALASLKISPEHIIVDGNRFKPFKTIPYTTQIKGDGRFMSIAAASVLAKTYRDEYMVTIHEAYPVYKWITNKGYGTQEHCDAMAEHGLSPYHRKSFQLKRTQLSLQF